MPTYRVTITKHLDDGPYALMNFSNVYHIAEASMAGAALAAPELVTLEKALYPDNVHIIRYSVSDPAAPRTGFSKSVFEAGNRSVGAVATQLPPFVTVLARLQVATGRPSLMHLRPIIDESEIDSGAISAALFTQITDNWATPLTGLGYVTDESAHPITAVVVDSLVRSRQLGWHRRTRPGFKRGWVPV